MNSTTVEVTFPEAVTELNELNFAIEGLTISNKVVKQTDSKTVVLTTSAQTADVEYTVTVNGEAVGKFKGVSAVVPTAVKTVVASQQGVIGKEVTLSAEVTVAEGQSKAGIPVTFNIVNDKSTNSKIEVVAVTNDKGVATYTYTRYYNGIDDVVAYATSKSSVKDNAKVYWASSPQLTIKEDKAGTTVANGGKKSYKITGEKNSVVFVAFEENLDIKSSKIQEVQVTSAVGYIDEENNYKPYTNAKDKELIPYELSTGAAQYVVIELDSKGEGSLIITGEDASVTPIVYDANSIGELDLKELDKAQAKVKKVDVEYNRTLLQAKADTVKFEQNDKLALDVKALGTEDAAQATALKTAGIEIDEDNDFGLGGRKYEVTVRTKDGELAAKGSKAYVTFEDSKDIKGDIQIIIDGVVHNVTKGAVLPITVEKDGKASFRVIGKGKDSYVTPTVFLNTDGSTAKPELDKKDVQVKAETTYFTAAEVKEAVIKVLDANDREVTSLQAGKKAYAVYQSVDQNGFAYGTGKKYDVTFELSTTFGELKVTGNDVQNVGKTYTYETTSNEDGRAVVEFTSDSATTVDIDILGSRNVLPTKVATMKFTQYATGETTGVIAATDVDNDTLTVGTNVYSYADAKEYQENGSKITKSEFEKLIVKANARVSITKDADGKLTFNVLETGTTTGSLVDKVNAATTAAQVNAALASSPLYKALTASEKTAVVATVYTHVSGTGVYANAAALDAELTAASSTSFGDIDTTAVGYTASQSTVTELKATATEALTGGEEITITSKKTGTAGDGYIVVIDATNTANSVFSSTYEGSTKTLTIKLAFDASGNTTTTNKQVIDAINAATELDVTATSDLVATDFATLLVAEGTTTITTAGGRNAVATVPAELELTFDQSVSATVGSSVTLGLKNGGTTVAVTGTVKSVADEVLTIVLADTSKLTVSTTYTIESISGVSAFTDSKFKLPSTENVVTPAAL